MKRLFKALILFLFAFSINAEELKIGIVDVNKILKDAPQTISATKKLEKNLVLELKSLKQKVKHWKEMEKNSKKNP